MVEERRCYVSYLLRLWETKREGVSIWRASLQSPDTGERTGFASLDALFAFLRQVAGVELDSGGDQDETRPG